MYMSSVSRDGNFMRACLSMYFSAWTKPSAIDLSTEVWKSTYSDNLYPVIYPLRTNDNTEVDIICNKPTHNNVVQLASNQVIKHASSFLIVDLH